MPSTTLAAPRCSAALVRSWRFVATRAALVLSCACSYPWERYRPLDDDGGATADVADPRPPPGVSCPVGTPVVLIPVGARWRVLDDGSEQGTAWIAKDFDDSTWRSGPSPLGYGGDGERTIVGFGGDPDHRFVTTYLRGVVEIADPSIYESLRMQLRRDDAAVVYLQGREILRDNLPSGAITSQTYAVESVSNAEELIWLDRTLDPSQFSQGRNVFAVEVHQTTTSADMSFDLVLTACPRP